MNTFRAIVFSSVVAGSVGAIVTVIQQFGTVPLILKAEVFEKAAEHQDHEVAPAASPGAVVAHNHVEHEYAAEAWGLD